MEVRNSILVVITVYQIICVTSSRIRSNTSLHVSQTRHFKMAAVYGGETVKTGQFPWMVTIHRLDLNKKKISTCGGTVISDRYVLTAAHCIYKHPRTFRVVFGAAHEGEVYLDYYGGPGISMITKEGAIHGKFDAKKHINDIGLLKMPRRIPFGPTIAPIQLAGLQHENMTFANKKAIILGWGKTGLKEERSMDLHLGDVSIMSDKRCTRSWRNHVSSQICTKRRYNSTACKGDSGGPLVVQRWYDFLYIQVGITSYHDGHCPNRKPHVFTRITAFRGWIEKNTGMKLK